MLFLVIENAIIKANKETEHNMSILELLMNEKYFLLKHINSKCTLINNEHFFDDTIDQIVEDTQISKRTVCRLLKSMETDGLIAKSKKNGRKYCIPNEVFESFETLLSLIEDTKSNDE